jgi:Insertion element 4 transposase N-terminal
MDCPESSGRLIEATGKGARRKGGKLPPHVVVYLVMALALFSDEDYEEVVAILVQALRAWGCWGEGWEPATKGAVTQARQRLGPEPVAELFSQVAEPVATLDTEGAFLGPWRLMSIDGTELDVPDTPANREHFGPAADKGPFPRVRLVTIAERASHALVLARMGPSASKGSGEQSLARKLYPGWKRAGC